jgi:type IV pilus assembly protein PilQ
VRQPKQIITSLMMGGALAALSATTVNAAQQPSQAAKSTPDKNLISQANQQPLVPNPKITIDGVTPTPGVGLATPAMPRAVAPPVGDISVSNLDGAIFSAVDLGSEKNIPTLVLKDAPVREVLELLVRNAGLNLVYMGTNPDDKNSTPSAPKVEPKITLNLRNEPVQSAFNFVLKMSGYEAIRVGKTIFVGAKLPDSIQENVVRTLRVNQISAAGAAAFLAAQGAEARTPQETTLFQESTLGSVRQTTTKKTIEVGKTTIADPQAPTLLRGLAVNVDERLNSITLVGTARKVEIASAIITRLDARRRQVALNVKIVDVNLSNTDSVKSSLSFKTGDTAVSVDQGTASVNFGGATPVGSTLAIPTAANFLTNPSKFLSSIQAQIVSGNGKILTDPTLVVQEGQKSTVNLTQDVFGGFKINTVSGTGATTSTREPIIKQAGLSLDILVSRIDDNGFVAVNVSPTVSSIGSTVSTQDGDIALLQSRTLNSGEIRLRDGQTLILSGIIQESDRTSVSKVPILGDIPILGALFRSTNKTNQRQEVVVLLTPQILDDNKTQVNYTPGVDARLMLGR